MSELFTMIQVNRETGEQKVIYGHASKNVMSNYWQAYVDEKHYVIIEEYKEKLKQNYYIGDPGSVRKRA